MQKILDIKLEANGKYKAACARGAAAARSEQWLKEACHLYAQAVEALGGLEIDLLQEQDQRDDGVLGQGHKQGHKHEHEHEQGCCEADRGGSDAAEAASTQKLAQIGVLKPQLFLNLGMANARLGDFVSCRRCCNVALFFCNENHCPMYDLPAITEDTDLLLPLVSV
jgi:hypothetical protein